MFTLFPKVFSISCPCLIVSFNSFFFFWSLPVLPGLHSLIPYYSFWLFTVFFLSVTHQHALTFPIPFLCLLSAILPLCPNTQISPDFLPFVITVTSFLWHPVIGIVPYFYYLSNELLKEKKKWKPFNRMFDIRPTLVHMWLLTLAVWPWVNYFNWFESQLYPLFKEGWYIPSFTYCEVQWDNFRQCLMSQQVIFLLHFFFLPFYDEATLFLCWSLAFYLFIYPANTWALRTGQAVR